jgi:hypothetical protein
MSRLYAGSAPTVPEAAEVLAATIAWLSITAGERGRRGHPHMLIDHAVQCGSLRA